MFPAVFRVPWLLPLALLAGCAGNWKSDSAEPPNGVQGRSGSITLVGSEIAAGLREALAQGTARAVSQLGTSDGFWASEAARIPLPPPIAGLEKTLRKFGQGQRVDDFHLALNRAAELAVPQVADIFAEALRQISTDDARAILHGSSDAATQYLKHVAGEAIRARMLPVVQRATAQVGVTQTYKRLLSKAAPVLQYAGRGSTVDLDEYVTAYTEQALFDAIAAEEARIRAYPAARGSELLRRVFASR